MAAIGVTQVIHKEPPAPVVVGDTESIFVALRDITPGELITPQIVKLEAWPRDKIPEGSLSTIEGIEGSRARTEILEGEPIREKKLLGKGVTQQTPTDYIPKGYRVVGVRVDLVSGAGLIRPGDRVDVMVHLKRDSNNDIAESRTQTILQDIKVFAVDDTFKLDPHGSEDDSTVAKTISLLVTPQQAERVVLASELGKVQLVMRSPGDNEMATTGGVTPSELMKGTEASDRLTDELAISPSDGKKDGLFGLLDRMSDKIAEPQPAPAPTKPQSWNVRMLQGDTVSDVTLEQGDPSAGALRWRLGSGDGSNPHPAAAPSAPPSTPETFFPPADADDAAMMEDSVDE